MLFLELKMSDNSNLYLNELNESIISFAIEKGWIKRDELEHKPTELS